MHILVGDQAYPLAQIGPDIVILKTPAILPAGPATVVLVVDDEPERRWDVILPECTEVSDLIHTRPAAAPIVA
jgi:hypothetical protein